jgi:EAL domain-containing protein (putative c-di-GMP-specific phosphodiesterase class I)
MVAMAHALGAATVGEGVERPEQAPALATLGVDRLQGFLTGRPMPMEDLRVWLAEFEPLENVNPSLTRPVGSDSPDLVT